LFILIFLSIPLLLINISNRRYEELLYQRTYNCSQYANRTTNDGNPGECLCLLGAQTSGPNQEGSAQHEWVQGIQSGPSAVVRVQPHGAPLSSAGPFSCAQFEGRAARV